MHIRKDQVITILVLNSFTCMHYFHLKGIDQVITMDLHSKEIQGFFNCPVDNLRASPFLIQYIQDKVYTYSTASKFPSLICHFFLDYCWMNESKKLSLLKSYCYLGITTMILTTMIFYCIDGHVEIPLKLI